MFFNAAKSITVLAFAGALATVAAEPRANGHAGLRRGDDYGKGAEEYKSSSNVSDHPKFNDYHKSKYDDKEGDKKDYKDKKADYKDDKKEYKDDKEDNNLDYYKYYKNLEAQKKNTKEYEEAVKKYAVHFYDKNHDDKKSDDKKYDDKKYDDKYDEKYDDKDSKKY